MERANRRKDSRVPFTTTASLVFPDKSYATLQTRDLSMKGIFVPGVKGRKIGDKCDMVLHLAGASSDISLRMKGEVVRTEKDGIGLHFYEIDIDSFYHLRNILYYNLENPDKLDDELSDHILAYQPID